jgi:hypothetical protein
MMLPSFLAFDENSDFIVVLPAESFSSSFKSDRFFSSAVI